MKNPLSILLALIVIFTAVFIRGCQSTTGNFPPSFIIIYTDDQQYFGAGVYNSVIRTPEMDKLAEQSFQFTNAHVAFSLCSPSRAALLTGNYGSRNGVLGLGSGLKEGQKTLPEYLNEAGYICGLSGKWHIQQKPESLGFDYCSYFIGNGSYYGRELIEGHDTTYPSMHIDGLGVQRSIAFIEACLKKDAPFFLFHCPQTPHMNGELVWDAKEETKQNYLLRDMPVPRNHQDSLSHKPDYLSTVRNRIQASKYGYPDSLAIQTHTRNYYSVITELDSFLGMLLAAVDSLGILDNTYIIFMSDNGWMLGDHGFTSKVLPYETSTHVPLWVYGDQIEKGINHSLVSNLDVLPTILELAGLKTPPDLDGSSLLPLLRREKSKIRDYFIYEGLGTYGGTKPNLTLLWEDLRYIVTFRDESLSRVEFKELYNCRSDSLEMINLVFSEKYSTLIPSMDSILSEFKQRSLSNLN